VVRAGLVRQEVLTALREELYIQLEVRIVLQIMVEPGEDQDILQEVI
jgi:hypothetical protein